MKPLESSAVVAPRLDVDEALRLARLATTNRTADAAQRWQILAALASTNPAICEEIARSLRELGQLAEADAVLRDAVARLPDSKSLAIAYARSAGAVGNAGEEVQRWAGIRGCFPDQIDGYMGGSRALRRLQRQQEAEIILAKGIELFGLDRRLLVDLALSVTSRGDWAAARHWWTEVDRHGWLDGEGYAGLGTAQLRAGDVEAARATLERGHAAYPDSPDISMGFAEVMTVGENWIDAVGIWENLVVRFPNNGRYTTGLGVAKWRLETYQTDHSEATKSGHLARPVDVGLVEDASARDLLERFESLGQDCEFGLVQRHFGAEPLGLLRWTTTKPDTLITGLRTRFAGLGELENTVLDLGKPEIMVNDLAVHIRFHTFIQQGITLDLDKFRQKQGRHLRYLRDSFIDRLENADRIYIYKYVGEIDRTKVGTMFEELRKFGRVSLIVITRASADKPGGSVEQIHDGLYQGYLSRYGLDNSGLAWNIAFQEWVAICRGVVKEIKSESIVG